MIIGLQHPGSGIGDQIFCYLAARLTAERLKVPFTMVGEFKGKSFLQLSNVEPLEIPHHIEMPAGKIIVDNDFPVYEGKSWYDPGFDYIEDNTIVDGCRIQDERYFFGHYAYIRGWLKSNVTYSDKCVINFRGGEFTRVPELFLPKSYWDTAITKMKEIGFKDFEIHTDDEVTARQFFPEYKIVHDVSVNWRSVRGARGAIIANSAFGIIPRLLKHYEDEEAVTIAPMKWSRPYDKDWSFAPQNYYRNFDYV